MPFFGAYSLTFEVALQATFESQEPFFGLLPGSHVASLWKTAPGAVLGSQEPFLEPLPTTI